MQAQLQTLISDVQPLGQGGGGVAPIPPGPTNAILTEIPEFMMTEGGDNLVQE